MATTDTRSMTLVDYPLVRRLTSQGTVLDSEVGLTRDARGPNSLLLSDLLFSRGLYTLVARSDEQYVVGQFRYRPDDVIAHIVYLAPALDEHTEDTVWLHILDAMSREAGKHGAHSLVAEVETSSTLFETLRTARFATYARQIIWQHEPFTALPETDIVLEAEQEADALHVVAFITHLVPRMVQQIALPPSEMDGWVYRNEQGRIQAYIGVSEGKQGVYLLPYVHPDVMDKSEAILAAAIAQVERASKVPVYMAIRNYHQWLYSSVAALGFEEWVEQAVMVKQIAAGIKHPGFARLPSQGTLEVSSCVPHPSMQIVKDVNKDKEPEEPLWNDASRTI